jgi:hypothetical protein
VSELQLWAGVPADVAIKRRRACHHVVKVVRAAYLTAGVVAYLLIFLMPTPLLFVCMACLLSAEKVMTTCRLGLADDTIVGQAHKLRGGSGITGT